MPERSITYCTPELQEVWYAALKKFSEAHPDLPVPFLTCTYRSREEQDRLFNQPWDHIDNDQDGKIDEADEKVTNARAGQSYHNFYPSRAFDVAFRKPNKQLDWNDHLFIKFAAVVKEINPKVTWGGEFKRFKDMPHFQL